jgi:P-type Cu2+ transporter
MGHHADHEHDLKGRTEHVPEPTRTGPAPAPHQVDEHASGVTGGHTGHSMRGAGHDRHEGHSVAMFRDKFWLSLALSVPVVLLSHDIGTWLGYSIPTFPGSAYLPALLGTVVFVYGGLVFLRGAQGELSDRKPGMMTLISLAIVVAFVTSWAGTLGLFEVEIWWELAALITIMLLGHWLEMRSIAQARGAVAALAELLPDAAERVTATGTEEVPIGSLTIDDIVLVRPGARAPADGVVAEGSADVDESMITGESRPVSKEAGDNVIAGTVVAGGSLRVRITATGDATALSGIMRLVAAAQMSASRAQALADKAAAILFYVALGAGTITLVFWWLQGDPEGALVRTATVLVIACPHALGLAIPLVIAISTSLGARNGLLVKDRVALERARTLDTVIFDKTGTLTKGEPALVGASAPEALRLAAAVEADSEHPLARAIVRGASAHGLHVPGASAFQALPGRGAEASVDGRKVAVGGPRFLADLSLSPLAVAADWDAQGRTVLHVIVDGQVAGAIALEDEIRPESKEAIDDLHALGVRVAMITGDSAPSQTPSPDASGSTTWRPRCCRRTRPLLSRGSNRAVGASRWSVTASTMPRPWRPRTLASRSAPARTSPSSRPASCSCGATRVTSSAPSNCRGRRTPRCSRISFGRPATTCWPSPWPPASLSRGGLICPWPSVPSP